MKILLRVSVNIKFRSVEIIVFDILNIGLVQSNGNRLTRFSFERPEYHITTVLYVETRNFFFWYRVCYYVVSLFLYIFRIANHNLVVNVNVIQCFSAHENAIYE
jgi:hypothetical protein